MSSWLCVNYESDIEKEKDCILKAKSHSMASTFRLQLLSLSPSLHSSPLLSSP